MNAKGSQGTGRRVSVRRCVFRGLYAESVYHRLLHWVVTILLIIAAFCSGFFGHSLLDAHAQEELMPAVKSYYTSIQIKSGDNLWNIARTYSKGSGYTVREYVEELKRINQLDSEDIHAGGYLTVVYFKDE